VKNVDNQNIRPKEFVKYQTKRSTITKLKFISLRMLITNFVKKSYFILVFLMSIVWVDI